MFFLLVPGDDACYGLKFADLLRRSPSTPGGRGNHDEVGGIAGRVLDLIGDGACATLTYVPWSK